VTGAGRLPPVGGPTNWLRGAARRREAPSTLTIETLDHKPQVRAAALCAAAVRLHGRGLGFRCEPAGLRCAEVPETPALDMKLAKRCRLFILGTAVVGRSECRFAAWGLVRPNVGANRPAEEGGVSLARDSGEAAARQAYTGCRSGSG